MDYTRLPVWADDARASFHVVVESPRGSTVKIQFDPGLGAFMLGKPLTRGLSYPFDWGFVAGTRGPDGDPLDALVRWDVSTWPGVVMPCRAIAVLKVDERVKGARGRRRRNDRLLCVPTAVDRSEHVRDLDALCQRERDEIAHFFLTVTAFTQKEARVLGWGDAAEARGLVAQHAL